MNEALKNLKKKIKGEVTDDKKVLATYSQDASLFVVEPAAVVYPKDIEDLAGLIEWTKEENAKDGKYSLTARSGGTDMSGGPLTESVVVDFNKYFNHIKELGGGYAVAEPGVFYRDFEKKAEKKGLLLPSYPASKWICTLGGMIANNSGGEKTLVYGKTEDYVEELKVVLRDGKEYTVRSLSSEELGQKKNQQDLEGEIYRRMHELVENNYDLLQAARPKVSKNSSGYFLWNIWNKKTGQFDLTKLFTGSQGTLGLITEARLRLVKPRKHSRLLVIFLKDLKGLADVVTKTLVYKPESFESYDDHTLKVALKVFPNIVRKLKGSFLVLLFKFLPEFWMALTGGIPKLVLIAEFTSDKAEEAHKKAVEAQAGLRKFGLKTKVTKSAEEAEKYWVIRRESFNLLRQNLHGLHTAPFIDDIVVRPDQLPKFLPKLYTILDEYDLIYTVAGHVGDANFHIIPLMDFQKPESKKIILELSQKVYDLIFEFKGSISGEHNDGLIRGPFLEKMYGPEVYNLFVETKKIFDPDNIFNPGKKVGADLAYAMEHIRAD